MPQPFWSSDKEEALVSFLLLCSSSHSWTSRRTDVSLGTNPSLVQYQRGLLASLVCWYCSDGQMRPLGPPAAPSVISAAPVTARGTIINPRRACAARVTVVVLCVCLSVCLSLCLFVYDYSRTTGYEAAYERYQHLQCHKGTKNKLTILLKRLRSRDMA